MTQFPDRNVKANYFQSPAYWDMPYKTPFCCHETASENICATLLHRGSQRSSMHLAEVWWSWVFHLSCRGFFCCYLQKWVQLHKAHIIQGLLAEHAWCRIRIPLLLLWMSVLGVSVVSLEIWAPSVGNLPHLEVGAELSPGSFCLSTDLWTL